MVLHKVFGVERDIDIAVDVFPTAAELEKLEEPMHGCEHGWFESVHENAKLHYRKFLPEESNIKAILIYMHGISTHGGKSGILKNGRKINMSLISDMCMKNGIAVYAHDMYGHGYSEGTRFYIPVSWETNKNDCVNFINLVASMHDGSIPIVLCGESYGSTLSIHVARQFQNNPSSGPRNFDSVILTGAAIIGDLPPYPVYLILRYALAPLFPRWIPFFMPNPISDDRIMRDPEVLAMRTDKRFKEMMVDGSGIPFRLGTAVGLVVALDDVRKKSIPGFKQPYCLIHGTEDHGVPISGPEFMWTTTDTPEAEREFHREEGAYHDIFADFKAEESMAKVIRWIEKRLTSQN